MNVSLGRWPFRRLPLDETGKLVTRLRRHGVTQAWAGSFDALFDSELTAANARLVAECRQRGLGLFLPFGTVNLADPDWEREFHRCVEGHRMRGLRLFPNYHKYDLAAPEFARLFSLAARRNIIVQIAASMEDERTQSPGASVPHVDAQPLVSLLQKQPDARLMLLNWHRAVKLELVKQLAAAGVCFDIATMENVGGVANLLHQSSAERVVFGSHAPFFYFESAWLKMKEAGLDPEESRVVRELNARRLLA